MASTSPAQAWKALRQGNERFVAGRPEHPSQSIEHRASLAAAQRPNAVVFGCADSRVAAEIIFDQGHAENGDRVLDRAQHRRIDDVTGGADHEHVAETLIEDDLRVDEFEMRHVIETGIQLLGRSTAIAEKVECGGLAVVGVTDRRPTRPGVSPCALLQRPSFHRCRRGAFAP